MPNNEYMDVISFRERPGGKAYPHKIGSAKHGKNGSINVYLESLPLPDKDGRVSLLISERQEQRGGGRREPQRQSQRDDDFDDTILF